MSKFYSIAGLAAVAACLISGVRNDSWTVIGPGGGGAQFNPTISPHDPNFVVLNSDMTGTYLTRDGGKSWRMINLRGVPRFYVFDPSDPKVIYAKTIGLFRTTDAGTTWSLVHPDPTSVTGSSMHDDHAQEKLQTAGAPESIQALAVDRKDSRTLHAVFMSRGQLSLRISRDWGATWRRVEGEVPVGAMRIYVGNDRRVYVIGSNRVAVFDNGSVRLGPEAPETFVSVSAGFDDAGTKLIVYGAAPGAVYVSRNGGDAWTKTTPAQRLRAIATSASHSATAYLSFGELRENGSRYFGVAKTTDYGATWIPVWKESRRKSPQVDNGWMSERLGPGWGEQPLGLAVGPTNPDLCYATDLGRTLRSTDGGATWKAAYTVRAATGAWTSTGLDVTTTYGIHFDPFNQSHVFISYTDIGLFESEDGGLSWQSATANGVPREWLNTTYWVVFDPSVRGRMWAVMSGTHDLPRPKMWRRLSPSSYKGGVVRSDDGGKTWRVTTNGIPQTAATHILLDNRGTPSARVLYVAGFGKGVFRSADGGMTWQLKNSGLPAAEPFVWRLAQDQNGVLYCVIARRSDDESIGTDRDGALYRSRDSAETWEKVSLPAGVNGPDGLAIDAGDPRRLYLAAWRRDIDQPDGGGGIYLSQDAGASWRRVLSKDQHVYDISIDPRDKAILYACGFESSAWRSIDRGGSWTRIRGFNFKWGHRVLPDPRNPSSIFITTFGGSVWHGPAGGDPTAIEDITTPVVAFSAAPK